VTDIVRRDHTKAKSSLYKLCFYINDQLHQEDKHVLYTK